MSIEGRRGLEGRRGGQSSAMADRTSLASLKYVRVMLVFNYRFFVVQIQTIINLTDSSDLIIHLSLFTRTPISGLSKRGNL